MKSIQNKKNTQKKQHFIPKFYLRNFSSDRRNVNIFHLKTRKLIPSPITSTCQESYFYGKDCEFENFLKIVDDDHAKAIQRIIESETIPFTDSNDYLALLSFLLVLHARTGLERELVLNYGDVFCDKYLKPLMQSYLAKQGMEKEKIADYSVKISNMEIIHKQSILHAIESIFGISDLIPVLIGNKTKIPFISSDNPVIFNNRIHLDNKFTGILSRGLQIHCPLCPQLYLLLYDPAFYSINQSKLPCLNDIKRLNALQFLHSNEILIAASNTKKDYLDTLCQEYGKQKSKKFVSIQTKKTEWLDDTTRSDYDQVSIENLNYHVNFLFLNFNHKSYRTFKKGYNRIKKDNINAVFPRDYEIAEKLRKSQEELENKLKQDTLSID